jgi:hypothetical protein
VAHTFDRGFFFTEFTGKAEQPQRMTRDVSCLLFLLPYRMTKAEQVSGPESSLSNAHMTLNDLVSAACLHPASGERSTRESSAEQLPFEFSSIDSAGESRDHRQRIADILQSAISILEEDLFRAPREALPTPASTDPRRQ